MFDGVTPTKFGRYQVAEPVQFELLHHRARALTTVDHEPPVPVLDQEDLLAQGIDVTAIVLGAVKGTDALGSCTCNAGTVSLAERRAAAGDRAAALGEAVVDGQTLTGTDAVADERFAIALYHAVTDQTGDPSQEWPPTDCGSTGLYVCTELRKLNLINGYRVGANVAAALDLLLDGTVIFGTPFFNAWMEPDHDGFIDGDGSAEALERAIRSGVAGGHEMCLTAVERAADDLSQVVVRVRNSWSEAWGDHGSCRLHASTLQRLGAYVDYKQFVI